MARSRKIRFRRLPHFVLGRRWHELFVNPCSFVCTYRIGSKRERFSSRAQIVLLAIWMVQPSAQRWWYVILAFSRVTAKLEHQLLWQAIQLTESVWFIKSEVIAVPPWLVILPETSSGSHTRDEHQSFASVSALMRTYLFFAQRQERVPFNKHISPKLDSHMFARTPRRIIWV